MKFLGLIFSCFFLFSVAAHADDAATFRRMLALAVKGDAEAQYHVGMMYNNGIGTGQDTRQAFNWFEKSAASDNALGAYKLGCYYAGQGAGVVKSDEATALKYKLVAAQAGYSRAQHEVAVHYAQQGNFEEAVKWLKLAAAQGFDQSLYGLSSSYHDGKGVPQDRSLAFAYLKLSLVMSRSGMTDRTQALLKDLSAHMSAAELAKAELFVTQWKPELTPLTIKAGGGIEIAEDYLRAMKQ
jgi:uncharacterized protein